MAQDIQVAVREVGLRDGLQSIDATMSTEAKQEWCRREHAAGVPEIEVCSFVPPKLLPQFSDAEAVVRYALTLDGLRVAVLVPNVKGALRAIEAGAHKLSFPFSVSESHSKANVRRSVAESLEELKRILALRSPSNGAPRPLVSGGLATPFGCSIEGAVDEDRVRRLAGALAEMGADEIVVADTVGYAHPAAVRRVFKAVKREVADLPVAAHFHDTRGLGLANVFAALDAGVAAFDASLGGFGGCPYAPGASGNIATEDLVFMLEHMGYATGVDLERLLDVRTLLRAALPDTQLHGVIAQAGLPKNYHATAPTQGAAAR